MITHTLATLGPKVLASRMVRDYTTQLYGPAARAGWALNGPRLRRRPRPRGLQDQGQARPGRRVHVDHVESSGVSDSPQIGETLHVRAYVSLGSTCRPRRSTCRSSTARRATATSCATSSARRWQFVESYEGGRHQFARTWRSPAPARSATPCGSCPSTQAWPAQRARPGRQRLTPRITGSQRHSRAACPPTAGTDRGPGRWPSAGAGWGRPPKACFLAAHVVLSRSSQASVAVGSRLALRKPASSPLMSSLALVAGERHPVAEVAPPKACFLAASTLE